MGVGQAAGGAGVGADQTGEALAEDALGAAGVGAAKLADDQAQGDGPVLAGEIGHRTPVAAVDVVGGSAAAGTRSRERSRDEQGDSRARGQDKVIET
jgi:hypothetical protein